MSLKTQSDLASTQSSSHSLHFCHNGHFKGCSVLSIRSYTIRPVHVVISVWNSILSSHSCPSTIYSVHILPLINSHSCLRSQFSHCLFIAHIDTVSLSCATDRSCNFTFFHMNNWLIYVSHLNSMLHKDKSYLIFYLVLVHSRQTINIYWMNEWIFTIESQFAYL